MQSLFGLSMSGIMIALLVIFTVLLLAVAWVALRRPVVFKLGVRNLPRRRAQTGLIVVGLMLSTLIISAALGTGDTVHHSFTREVYSLLGGIDELVTVKNGETAEDDPRSATPFDASALAVVDQVAAQEHHINGVMPMLFAHVPMIHDAARQAEPDILLAGMVPERLVDFGGLIATDGSVIDLGAINPDEIVLSERAAEKLAANVGDQVTLRYANTPATFTVAAIAQNSTLSGVVATDTTGAVMSLDRLQELTGQTGQISAIAISNVGTERTSLDHSDAVTGVLEAALLADPATAGLGVATIKADLVKMSEDISSVFTGLFLVLGLFSVAAGILLIVLIFTMLAAERRAEMGMARAVGQQRGQLIQQFISEGAAYALLAGMVGAALGVGATYVIAWVMGILFGDFLAIDPYVAPRSLVVAYCLGMVITFVAVIGSSWKVSRLNVVAAIRDLSDVSNPRRQRRVLAWGMILSALGGLITLGGASGDQLGFFLTGLSVATFGIALILRFIGIPGRPVFSLVGVIILTLWALPGSVRERFFGEMSSNMEFFFLAGTFMVIGASIVIVQNLDLLLGLVGRMGGVFQTKLPAIRTAVAYPGAAKGRTGMTIAMFSLIIFSLVMIATLNANFVAIFLSDEANAGWDVRADTTGANPLPADFITTLNDRGVDTIDYTATGTVYTANDWGRIQQDGGTWGSYPIRGMDEAFIAESNLMFSHRAEGFDSDAAIIDALATQPNVAVLDGYALDGGIGDDDMFIVKGVSSSATSFTPFSVEIEAPNGQSVMVTVIGVIDSKVSSLWGLYTGVDTLSSAFPNPALVSYFVAVGNADNANQAALDIESALLENGVQVISIRDELKTSQEQNTGFLYLIQGFMALGLIVGIAAIGVIAFRSVVERRQQIGVLRAIGYSRQLVAQSFLIETGFIVSTGAITGTGLGLILARNMLATDSVGASASGFLIPYPLIGLILVLTIVAALVMTWVPSRQAAGIAPAEALRYE